MEWINIKDKEPSVNKEYLVTQTHHDGSKEVLIAYYSKGEDDYHFRKYHTKWYDFECEPVFVDAWMELPKPYEE